MSRVHLPFTVLLGGIILLFVPSMRAESAGREGDIVKGKFSLRVIFPEDNTPYDKAEITINALDNTNELNDLRIKDEESGVTFGVMGGQIVGEMHEIHQTYRIARIFSRPQSPVKSRLKLSVIVSNGEGNELGLSMTITFKLQ